MLFTPWPCLWIYATMTKINAEQLNKTQDIIKLIIEFRVAIPNGKKNGIETCAQ